VFVIGCDIEGEALKLAKVNLDAVVFADAATLPFRAHVFDRVIASEIIEHVDQSRGNWIISEGVRVGKTLTVTTPNGFIHGDAELVKDYPLMQHKCGYTAAELKQLGAKRIVGVGWRFNVRKLAALLWFLPYFFPWLSSTLVATWRREET
jgi:ubiquinone/menaquinone biosynthesis C-methylase UbiE